MMIVKKGGAALAAPVEFKLGHGAVLKARVLDAFEHKVVQADARSELNAILADAETKHAWVSLDSARRKAIRADEAKQSAVLGWMHAVLLAAASAVALEGVIELTAEESARLAEIDARVAEIAANEDADAVAALAGELTQLEAERAAIGRPLAASFETFELLFNDAGVEAAFRLQAFKVEEIWSAEKNVSRPGPNGSGPVAANIVAPAATQGMPAPAADGAATEVPAPPGTTDPAPPKASSPGSSPAAAEAGTS